MGTKLWAFTLFCIVVLSSLGCYHCDDTPVYVRCDTTKGSIRIEVHPEWAPLGAARFLELVDSGFFTDVGLTRVLANFLVQFGIAAEPKVQSEWENKGPLKDDPIPPGTKVKRGYMAYAGGGQNTRTTQMWIAYRYSSHLGTEPWETPFGFVLEEDMHVVDAFYAGYGDMEAFGGHGPDQGRQKRDGNEYLRNQFPQLDYILSCKRTAGLEPAQAVDGDLAGDDGVGVDGNEENEHYVEEGNEGNVSGEDSQRKGNEDVSSLTSSRSKIEEELTRVQSVSSPLSSSSSSSSFQLLFAAGFAMVLVVVIVFSTYFSQKPIHRLHHIKPQEASL